MIYEFFGLPGSGKTHLARAYARENGARLIEVNSRFAMYAWALAFACLRPRIFFTFLREIIKENRHDKKLLRHKTRVLHIHTMAKEGRALFVRGDVIFDEGLLQALLSVYEREIIERDFTRFFKFFKNRKIYLVHAVVAVREARMHTRGRVPRAFLGRRYRHEWFRTLTTNHERICIWAKHSLSCKEVNNEQRKENDFYHSKPRIHRAEYPS